MTWIKAKDGTLINLATVIIIEIIGNRILFRSHSDNDDDGLWNEYFDNYDEAREAFEKYAKSLTGERE